MSFLNPEPKPSFWKLILQSPELKRLIFIIFLAGIMIAFMIIMLARWKEVFPPETPASNLPAELTTPSLSTNLTEALTPTPPSPSSITPTPIIHRTLEGLEKVEDRTPLEADEYYMCLLDYVAKHSPEEISRQVNPNITYQDLMREPQKYRGQFIRAKGALLFLETRGDIPTNPSNITWFYDGMTGSITRNEFYRFHLIDRPPKLYTIRNDPQKADDVWVEGAFLKIIQYEKRDGGFGEVPFLIGRRIGKIEPQLTGMKTFQAVMVGLIVVVIGGLIVIFYIGSRKDKLYRQKRMEKWKSQLNSKKDSTSSLEAHENSSPGGK